VSRHLTDVEAADNVRLPDRTMDRVYIANAWRYLLRSHHVEYRVHRSRRTFAVRSFALSFFLHLKTHPRELHVRFNKWNHLTYAPRIVQHNLTGIARSGKFVHHPDQHTIVQNLDLAVDVIGKVPIFTRLDERIDVSGRSAGAGKLSDDLVDEMRHHFCDQLFRV